MKYLFLLLSVILNLQTNISQISDDRKFLPDTIDAEIGDNLIVRIMTEPESLNPIVSNNAVASEISSYIFETLLNQNKETYELLPGIADLPEISTNRLKYTFTINKEAKFSDGKPLTANDIIFTLKTIKNPFVYDDALRNYFEIVEKAEIVDGDLEKVTISLNKPNWRAIYILSALQIIPEHILDPDKLNERFTWNELNDNKLASKNKLIQKYADFINSQEVSMLNKYLIGSGPYMLESWENNNKVVLSRNTAYWNGNVPNYLNKIIFKVIQDNNEAFTSLMNKEIDVLYVLNPYDFYENLKNAEELQLVKGEPFEPAYTYLAWNELNPIFKDKNVRIALSHLIDRNVLIDKFMYGNGVKIHSHIFFKNLKLLNNELAEINYDLDLALRLLIDDGWKDTDGNGILEKTIGNKKIEFKFTFLTNTNPLRRQILQFISDDLKKIGIQSDIQDVEWSIYLDKIRNNDFDATYGAWTSPTIPPDPYQIWHSSQIGGEGSNYINFNNKINDSLIDAYRIEYNEEKRIQILKEWQKLIYEEQPYTFLWSPRSRYVCNKRFKNVNWYNSQPSPSYNEWWVPKNMQKY